MLRARLRADDGFTLVELLVVITIVGVLATITLSAFLDQKGKAQDAEAKTADTFTVSVDSAPGDAGSFSTERKADGATVRDCATPRSASLPRRHGCKRRPLVNERPVKTPSRPTRRRWSR